MQTNAGKIPQASLATFLGNRSRGKKPQPRTTRSCTVLGAGPGLVYGFLESSYMLPAQVVTTATKAAAAQPGRGGPL